MSIIYISFLKLFYDHTMFELDVIAVIVTESCQI